MPKNYANINAAARQIAKAMGMQMAPRVEDEVLASMGYLKITWKLWDGASSRVGSIRLECERGYEEGGKSWAGQVTIELAPDLASTSTLIALRSLVQPAGMVDGGLARKKTKEGFCNFAKSFVMPDLPLALRDSSFKRQV